jgi:hypothetical protein
MAEMGLGYGSEYHLLRYLGHHRNELNEIINQNTRLKGELIWLDYPKDLKRLSLDGEYLGVDFLNDKVLKDEFSPIVIEKLLTGWKKYWSGKGKQPNLDGVILHKNENQLELVIVEAKANLKEIESNTKSASNERIKSAFRETQDDLKIENSNWFGKHYQLANRLALVNFLSNYSEVNISASLLYIYFLNGYERRKLDGRKIVTVYDKSVKSQNDWEVVIKRQYEDLGLDKVITEGISKIFIDCK